MSDLWDEVVGIPLDDWMRATTVVELDWLIWFRDHPLPPRVLSAAEVARAVRIFDMTGRVVRYVFDDGRVFDIR